MGPGVGHRLDRQALFPFDKRLTGNLIELCKTMNKVDSGKLLPLMVGGEWGKGVVETGSHRYEA